jgi:DNA-binding transcriptional regulator YiaG
MKSKAIYDSILSQLKAADARKTPLSPDEATKISRQLKELRYTLNLTPNQCARLLGVAVQTLYRWESAQPPRLSAFRQFEKLLPAIEAETPANEPAATAPPLEAAPTGAPWEKWAHRTLKDILDRERRAKTVYLLKTRAPFLSGEQLQTRRQMIEIIAGHIEARHEFHFRFFCTDTPSEARDSYCDFRSHLNHGHSDFAERVHGWTLPKEVAFDLGLGDNHLGWVVIEYQPGQSSQFPRDRDIFVEVPVAELLDRESNLQDTSVTRYQWFEYPDQFATPMWEKRWLEILNRIMKEEEIQCK